MLNENIRALRRARGLSQEELAARLEELNALLARRAESRRRRWRVFSCLAGVLALLGGALAYPEEISGKDCTGGSAGVYW